jgi:hypothetical protein
MFEANWDVARLGAAQNFLDIVGGAPVQVRKVMRFHR